MDTNVVVFLVIFWVIPMIVGYSQGKPKDRNGLAYGMFLGWLGVFILALLPASRGDGKRCPDCAEMVNPDALICRHCGFRFDGLAPTPS